MSDQSGDENDRALPDPVITGDGSHTLYSNRYGQHYHNPGGAISESRHIFLEKSGIIDTIKAQNNLSILEVGFGTGLNLITLLDLVFQMDKEINIRYDAVEASPLAAGIFEKLNYEDHVKHPEIPEMLNAVFRESSKGNNYWEFIPGVNFNLFVGLFENFDPDDCDYDFIFHDPFSPDVNPDLWTGDVFKKLKQWSSREAILVTYSAASKARGAMAWAGWHVARAEGALGKREMTIASTNPEKLVKYERVNEQRLASRYENDSFV